MNYIFIVNHVMFNEEIVPGGEIAKKLFDKKMWLFSYSTPNIKKIKPGDNVLLYIAGYNNKFFGANFKIDGQITEHDLKSQNKFESYFYNIFPLGCKITNINIWDNLLSIYDVKEELEFIKDKKNWGLFFRQATKVINDNDYKLIMQERAKQK